jgi:hypothetical protein
VKQASKRSEYQHTQYQLEDFTLHLELEDWLSYITSSPPSAIPITAAYNGEFRHVDDCKADK